MTDGDADTVDSFHDRLADAESDLEAAATEANLDGVEAELDDIESDLETANLPEPDDEDEDNPRETVEDELESLRSDLEDARGPYAEDVVEQAEAASNDVDSGDWTDAGRADLETAVSSFVDAVESELDTVVDATVSDDVDEMTAALDEAAATISDTDIDPDEDAETIAALLEAASELQSDVDAAQEWTDLSIRDRLDAHGFYDVLDHLKDYPPEWHAIKVYEKRGNAEMILLALDLFESNFMEDHCIEALKKLGDETSVEPMLERANKRDRDAIEVLGKIGSEEAVDTLIEYVDTPKDPLLQKATIKALGEIGSEEATQEIANQLVAESESVRSHAARGLGLLGDTRAIEPLADVLADDESDTVRASAAWALNQIGTERALDHVVEYADDRAYLVQAEAEKVA